MLNKPVQETNDPAMMELMCAICPQPGGYHVKYEAAFRQGKVDERTFSARRTPERNHYRMVQCRGCGLLFSTPAFREGRLKALYAGSCFTCEKEVDNGIGTVLPNQAGDSRGAD